MTDTFPTIVYVLCFLASSACAGLLARSYRATGARLLLWSAICFGFLAANNLVLVLDLVIWPYNSDLRLLRLSLTLAAAASMIWGFVWDIEED